MTGDMSAVLAGIGLALSGGCIALAGSGLTRILGLVTMVSGLVIALQR